MEIKKLLKEKAEKAWNKTKETATKTADFLKENKKTAALTAAGGILLLLSESSRRKNAKENISLREENSFLKGENLNLKDQVAGYKKSHDNLNYQLGKMSNNFK